MKCSICGGTKYTDALKKYNKGKPEWCMPRKGTPGHTEILSIIAKPKRRLHQKRILDSAQSKEVIVEEKQNMEIPKRKLRSVKELENSKLMAMEDKDAPEMKVIKKKVYKEEKCPICGKSFKNLKQHIFKSHTKIHLTFKKDGDEYLLDAVTNDGKVLAANNGSGSTGYNLDGSEFSDYFMGEHLVGWTVTLSKDKKVKVTSSILHPKTGNYSEGTAFKNWDVKFIENEDWKKLPQLKKIVEEEPVVEERQQKKPVVKEVKVLTTKEVEKKDKAKEKRLDKKWKEEINKKKKEREELEQLALTNERAKIAFEAMKNMDKYNLERTGNIYGVPRPIV